MNTASIVTLSFLGFTWGYQPLDQETAEYIVQLRQHELQVLADGTHEIISVIPPEARPVGRIRILVGTEALPRQTLPPKLLHMPVEPARPVADYGQGADNRLATLWRTGIGGQGGTMARNRVAPTYGRSQPNPSWTSVYGTRTNNWGGVDPLIQPGPVDDTTMGSGWGPPLALPSQWPSNVASVDPNRTPTAPWATGPAMVNPRDSRGMNNHGNANDRDGRASTQMTDIQLPPQQPLARPPFGNGNMSDATTGPDRRGTVEVPPRFERGQDQGIRHSKLGGSDIEARGQDSRFDWGALASLPESPTTEPNKTESENNPPGIPPGVEPSSFSQPTPTSPSDDNSPWRAWTLLLGPVAIALAGLNVYQWGIYKSVRRRYLTLLRRTGEV